MMAIVSLEMAAAVPDLLSLTGAVPLVTLPLQASEVISVEMGK